MSSGSFRKKPAAMVELVEPKTLKPPNHLKLPTPNDFQSMSPKGVPAFPLSRNCNMILGLAPQRDPYFWASRMPWGCHGLRQAPTNITVTMGFEAHSAMVVWGSYGYSIL